MTAAAIVRQGEREHWRFSLDDLANDVVIVATAPSDTGYARVAEHRAGATIAPAAFADITIDVTTLLRR